MRISNRGGGKVDNDRFALAMLEVLVKGGKDAQGIAIGGKPKGGESSASAAESNSTAKVSPDDQSTPVDELTAELEKTRLSLTETERDLSDKSEQLSSVVSERDNLRRVSEQFADATITETTTPSKTRYSVATPNRAIGMARGESIQDILTTLSSGYDGASDAGVLSPDADAISEGTEGAEKTSGGS